MSQGGRVVRAVLNYGLGSYVPQLINFLLVPLYTRYLNPTEMGVLEAALCSQALIILLMRFGLNGAIARLSFDAKEGTPAHRDLITTMAATTVAITLAIGAVTMLVGPSIFGHWFPEVSFAVYGWPIVLGAATGGFPDIQRRLLQTRERSAESALLSGAMAASSTLANVIAVIGLNSKALGAMWATVVVGVLFTGIAIFRIRDDLKGAFRTQWLKAGLTYGAPLLPHHVAAWLQQNVGRFFLLAAGTSSQLGVLAVASRLASPLAVLTSAFSSAYTPVYFSWRSQHSPEQALIEAKRVATTVLTLGAIAVLGAGTAGGWVARHLLADSYREGAVLVGMVALANLIHLLYTVVTCELFFSKRTSAISLIFVAASAINSGLVYVAVPRYGAPAAALSQVAGGVASLALVSVMARRSFQLPLDTRSLIGAIPACGLGIWAPFASSSFGAAADGAFNLAVLVIGAGATVVLTGATQHVAAGATYVKRRFKLGRAT